MKKILPALGVLLLAQLVFVGLIHVFLLVQGKNSPETLATLSRLPVIGGFFPEPEEVEPAPTAGDIQDEDMKRFLAEGDELFRLPKEIPRETVNEVLEAARSSRKRYEDLAAELQSELEALEIQKAQVLADRNALTQRIETLASSEQELEARWKELEARQRIVEAEEEKSYLRLGEIYARMSPDKAALVLKGMVPEEAARILAGIEPRNQGKIFDAMEIPVQVEIQKHMLKPAFRPAEGDSDNGAGKK